MSDSENQALLSEILKWLKFLGWSKAKTALNENLKDTIDLLIYHFSDGHHGIRDIIPEIESYNFKTSYGGIHGKWQRWAQNGIVYAIPSGSGIRYVKLFNIEDFGYELPEKPNQNANNK